MTYKEYLRSELWKSIRKAAIARDKGKCTKCGTRKRLCVHHICCPEVLGTENIDSLVTLCEDCHNVLHGGSPRGASVGEKIKAKKAKKKQRGKYAPKCKVFTPAEIREYEKTIVLSKNV